MKYMLLVYLDEHSLSEAEREHCYVESAQLARELNAQGKYISAGPLHPTATATSVRVRNGKRLVTDGPFAETREQLGGYYLIEAPNLDAAMKHRRTDSGSQTSARLKSARCWRSRDCRRPVIKPKGRK